MAEFKISRIRYTWRGGWTTTTAYNRDDVVRYGGSTWICIRQHTAATFAADQAYLASETATDPSPAWLKMTDGYAFRGNWASTTLYNPNDIVLYGGLLYLCTISHTSSSTFAANDTKFSTYFRGINWRDVWQANTRYGVGDVVNYGGRVYICSTEHTSAAASSGLNANISDWTIYYKNAALRGTFTQNTYYGLDDLVKYGGSIYRTTSAHYSSSVFSPANFTIEFPGYNNRLEWAEDAYYAIGDVVKYGGDLYKAILANTASAPGDSIYQPTSVKWVKIVNAINYLGNYDPTQAYKTGDLVRRGGYLYVALLDIPADGSTSDYLDTSNWEVVIASTRWRNFWEETNTYLVGDLVQYRGTVWSCNTPHVSSEENFPSLDSGSGFYYWDIVLLGADDVALSKRGQVLAYGLERGLVGDTSTLGPVGVDIGTEDHLLMINANDDLGYEEWGSIVKVVYVSADDKVALDDEFDPERGYNPFKPFRTIRFACEQVEKLGPNGYELITIKVRAGLYDEVLPIIVPANVNILGDELRSVTVRAKAANAALASDSTYTIAALSRIETILADVLDGVTVTKSTGNTENQISPGALTVNGSTKTILSSLINDMQDYIDFNINSGGTNPTVTGTNTLTAIESRLNAAEILTDNREFLAAEAAAYIAVMYPAYNFIPDACKRDMRRYVDALIYDIQYPGNYKSVLAARYYTNAVLGSSGEDMFYLRNATGIRNMTLKGLEGILNPPGVNELYRRPTGGAYASLDPGWGPADNRTWITSRSPYCQNCTTFGYAAVGQKIDGALHNGGNKSIVSNDFTQVISDGIGAWVLNGGRAELVSVFTYYSQIGMFAEDGGIIRATNGNSSYGDFGAIADGNDPTETPRFAQVNNRTSDAVVAAAFSGEVNDEILILEFANAGEQYTQANYAFVGSGINAQVVQEEFRDNAVFEIQVGENPAAPNITVGGTGYTLVGGNAQSGNLTTITIASNDTNEEADLLGCRLTITSGPGTGQYGYIYAYNDVSKLATIYRESDGQPGWDHVLSGYPSVDLITTQSTYRIEPRLTFSAPPFTTTSVDLGATQGWGDVAYGETYETFLAVSGSGAGVVGATFDVVKTGRTYTVTLDVGGAGYVVGDQITIEGADVGGVTGEHDIIVTVSTITDDSTASLVTFTHTGIASSGKFIAVPSSGDLASGSKDGDYWEHTTLPTSGNWIAITHGAEKFVAIRNNSNQAAYSGEGTIWTGVALPTNSLWRAVKYGKINNNGEGVFLAVAENTNNAAYSETGTSWSTVTLPSFGDSTLNNWVDVAFGRNKFVVLANSQNIVAVGEYNPTSNVWTWDAHVMDVIADSSQKDWVSIAYGNNRFVAISTTGDVSYSFDGEVWYAATMPSEDGSTAHYWRKIRYGQGVFFAVGDSGSRTVGNDPTTGESTFAATSYDGITWTSRTLPTAHQWRSIGFGNPDTETGDSTVSDSRGMWIVIPADASEDGVKIRTGARTLGRAVVEGNSIKSIRLWEPGSGYTSAPTLTITDPNNGDDAYTIFRLGDGVLAQPSFINRGTNYKTSSTVVTVSGDGYADLLPLDRFVTLSGLTVLPGPGTQFRFRGETEFWTVATVELDSQEQDGTFTGVFRIGSTSLRLNTTYNLEHGSQCEIRERYSQVRITGHDFLDVGTGNFVETNYPVLYTAATDYFVQPENEVVELNGGRTFYTSTDQSGNFRCGELFSVEQASGIVTISADFFDLSGLTELALGGVRLGGSGAVVREFSTDPNFTADSNNVVPTQRAIKAYLQNRLNVGGSDLLTADFIAGTVKVGPQEISNSASLKVIFPIQAVFDGQLTSGQKTGISGSWPARMLLFASYQQV